MTAIDDTAYEERHRLLTLSWWQLVCMSAGVRPAVDPEVRPGAHPGGPDSGAPAEAA